MTSVETAETGVDSYIERLSTEQSMHRKRVGEIRDDILADRSLPKLDRVVLGLTGSPETLSRYQLLAEKLGNLCGQPIIVAEYESHSQAGLVDTAEAGILSGLLHIRLRHALGHPRSPVGRRKINGATLSALVDPAFSYRYTQYGDIHHHFDSGPESRLYDSLTGCYLIELANFHPRHIGEGEYACKEIQIANVYMGREQIYASPHFNQGVSRVLARLEEINS